MNEPPSELEYVGFWSRVLASLIDTVLILIVTAPLLLAIYGPDYFSSPGMIQGPADVLVSYILPAIAVVAFWTARHATPGKMAIGARIVDARSGGAPSLAQYIGRYFGYFVSSIPFGLGLIWVGLDPRKQGWHDKLAGTVVVRAKDRGTKPVRFG